MDCKDIAKGNDPCIRMLQEINFQFKARQEEEEKQREYAVA